MKRAQTQTQTQKSAQTIVKTNAQTIVIDAQTIVTDTDAQMIVSTDTDAQKSAQTIVSDTHAQMIVSTDTQLVQLMNEIAQLKAKLNTVTDAQTIIKKTVDVVIDDSLLDDDMKRELNIPVSTDAHTDAQTIVFIDSAQTKRNLLNVANKQASPFCYLTDSSRQNYKIDCALSEYHSMNELKKITACTETRIISHMKYIKLNCNVRRETVTEDNTVKFRYVKN